MTGDLILRRKWVIAAGWALAAALLLPFARQATQTLKVGSGAPEHSEALWVEHTLATQFASPFAIPAVLVLPGVSVRDSSGRAIVREISDSLLQSPDVAGVLSYLDVRDSAFMSPIGTFLVVGLTPDSAATSDVMIALRDLTGRLQRRLRTRVPSLELDWTGAPAFDYDVRLAGSADAAAAERRVLPITLVALVLVFGSVIAAVIPVAAGALAIGMSTGAALLISRHWSLAILVLNLISMIGLGLGIDYALLMITRFRSSLAAGQSAGDAALDAARYAGHTIVLSGSAVAIGFAPLLMVPAMELRSMAVGGLLVVTVSVLLATTVLPVLLASLGTRVEIGRLWKHERSEAAAVRWRVWGHWVADHPLIVLVVIGTPLVLLAAQARRASTSLPSGTWLPPRIESTRGATTLQRMGHMGAFQMIRVVVSLPAGSRATSDAGWTGVLRMSRRLGADPRVARVHSLPLTLGAEHPSASLLSVLSGDAMASFASRDERLALIELEPREHETPAQLEQFVREIRRLDAPALTGVPGSEIRVGGLPASNADYQDAIDSRDGTVVLIVVCGTFVALMLGFRSVLVALKATLLNLLSVGAAIGAAVLVFQDGHGIRLVGLSAPVDGLFPPIPLIVFCIVFGLSMDYEVFLVGRVAEFVRAGMNDREALVEGLARTAGVITNAALVMILVFAGFAAGDFLIVKILGFTLAVAVLIDATLVRMAVGPALLRLAGKWNWWPGR